MNRWNRIFTGTLLAVTVFVFLPAPQTSAQQKSNAAYSDRKREINENVVSVMASGTSSPYTVFAEDMRDVLDQGDTPGGLRILPILGKGGANNAPEVCSGTNRLSLSSRTSCPPL